MLVQRIRNGEKVQTALVLRGKIVMIDYFWVYVGICRYMHLHPVANLGMSLWIGAQAPLFLIPRKKTTENA